jgi:hypothetical protein
VSIVLHRPKVTGRHRLGRPGLIPLTALVSIRRRNVFTAWFRRGKHRHQAIPVVGQPARLAPVVASRTSDNELELAAA